MKSAVSLALPAVSRPLPDLDRLVEQIPRVTCSHEAAELFRHLEVAARQVDAAKALLAAQIHRHDLHRADGYVKLATWARTEARVSSTEANHFARAGRLIASYPKVGELYYSGTVGTEHLRRLASLHQNKRVASELPRFMPLFLEWAQTMDVDVFTAATQRWEQLADADGTHRHSDRVHEERDTSINTFNDATFLDGKFGNVQGALLHEVHDRFCHRELQHDLAERDRLGLLELPRTSGQRRADALYSIFAAAADTLPPSIEPLVNIVIDAATYETALRAIEEDRPLPSLVGKPADFPHLRCETVSGSFVDPIEAVMLSLIGQVRRVVFNSASTVTDLGRRSRLFTGSTREAVFIRGKKCIWPGCWSRHTQADHITPWSEGGTTSPPNGAPLCPHHNRLKNTGYATARLDDGRFKVTRPDGSVIAPI